MMILMTKNEEEMETEQVEEEIIFMDVAEMEEIQLTLTPLLCVANKSLNYNDTHTIFTQGDSSDTIQYFYLLHVHYLCQQIQQQ